MKQPSTSWGSVAQWYGDVIENPESYQQNVIGPNLLRLMDLRPKTSVLDLACGEGWFARLCEANKAVVVGVDIAPELINAARKKSPPTITYHSSSAHRLSMIADHTIDRVVIVLALQNIQEVAEMLQECRRVLATGGRLLIVLNHPSFRIPKQSSWGWDEAHRLQYRRVDGYLSESRQMIVMHPGTVHSASTISFHRPLQWYVKQLAKSGFCLTRLEEWISHKKSQKGPRGSAEDRARKEFPLFLCLEARFDHVVV